MRVLFLFVDGVGVGPPGPANPLSVAKMNTLQRILGGRRLTISEAGAAIPPLYALDARLGVPGLPQSGTGQTTLITGVNAARLLGRHRGPYPGKQLHPLLESSGLWRRLAAGGLRTALANAYPDSYLERVRRGTGRMSAITRAASLAGVRLRGPDDLRRRRGASAFLTNEVWRTRLGYPTMPLVSEEEAGMAVAEVALEHDFTAFEYHATDIAGHGSELTAAVEVLESYDRFLSGALSALPVDDLVVIASDHGNIEDLSTARHTLNPAACIWRGAAPECPLEALDHVAPAIERRFGLSPAGMPGGCTEP